MKKFILVFLASLFMCGSIGCTEKERTRSFGGNSTIELKSGEKLVVVTWKETDLWILTRQMREDEVAETYKFVEDSSWGIMEGSVTIVEKR